MATPTTLPATFVAGNVLTAAQMNGLRGAFRILQTVSTLKTDTFTSTTAGAFTDITGYSVSITPSSTSSKILLIATMNCTVFRPAVVARGFRFVRDSTAIAVGDAAGSRIQASFGATSASDEISTQISGMVLDSPNTTSATTYKVQFRQGNSTAFYLNRSTNDSDSTDGYRMASSITAFEVSA
jgi:hypothetical protein